MFRAKAILLFFILGLLFLTVTSKFVKEVLSVNSDYKTDSGPPEIGQTQCVCDPYGQCDCDDLTQVTTLYDTTLKVQSSFIETH